MEARKSSTMSLMMCIHHKILKKEIKLDVMRWVGHAGRNEQMTGTKLHSET
jgi:hypothetical protein